MDLPHHLLRARAPVLIRAAPKEVPPEVPAPLLERADLGAALERGVGDGGVALPGGGLPPEDDLPHGAGEGVGALNEETVGVPDEAAVVDDVEEGVARHHDVAADLTEKTEWRQRD